MDFLLVWLFSFVFGYWVFKKIKEWKDLPPGPCGLPVLGYLPFMNPYHPHLTLTALSKKYGPIYGIGMGNVYTVVLSDHKLIREALAKDVFAGRAPLYLTHGIMHGNGIICAEGALWKDQRKLVQSWLKSFGMSKHSVSRDKLEKRIATCTYELIQNIDWSLDSPLDLLDMMNDCEANAVNEIVFGFKFPANDKTWCWFRKIQKEGSEEMGIAGAVNFLPFLRFFSSSTRKAMEVITRGQAQTHRLYASIVARRRKMLGLERPSGAEYPLHENIFNDHPEGHIKCITYSKIASNTKEHYFDPQILIPTEEDCILDSFLLEQKKRFDNDDDSKCYMSDEQLLYLMADMFGAGLDTTSVTLGWFFLYMALYQDEQEIIRKEVLSVYPEEVEIEYSRLPRLMAALSETQRIRSIVPVGVPHGSLQEAFINDYKIPKGCMIVPLLWAVHMDPNIWEDPDQFKPSRFLDSDGSLLKPQEFIPFQTGKRMCPGDELSRMLTCGLIARLLRRFNVRLSSAPPTPEQMKGVVGITLNAPHVLYTCERLYQK